MAPRNRLMTEPARSFFFPTPNGLGFSLNVYETLAHRHIVVYEIKKPNQVIPFCFIVRRFETHEKFFHDVLNTDEFDSDEDHTYLRRLWYLLCPTHGPWDPDHFEFSIAVEDEPELVRGHGRAVVLRLLLTFTQPYDLFEHESDEEDERSLTPPPMVREGVGR